MNADLVLVIGTLVAAFSIPSVVSAWSERRSMTVPGLSLALGIALAVYANALNDWQYQLNDVPMAFLNVIALVLH